MPSLPDTAVIILLGLLLFGPKGLAQIARQLGKLMGEFRRASNEFRMQMEEELRIAEQADRQKQIAAVEAAAPVAPVLASPRAAEIGEDHPHLPASAPKAEEEPVVAAAAPLPIATSGDLSLMPPATGLPTPRSATATSHSVSSLIDSVPKGSPEERPSDELTDVSEQSHSGEDQRPMRYTNGHGALVHESEASTPQGVVAGESLHG